MSGKVLSRIGDIWLLVQSHVNNVLLPSIKTNEAYFPLSSYYVQQGWELEKSKHVLTSIHLYFQLIHYVH